MKNIIKIGDCPSSKVKYKDEKTALKASRDAMLFRDAPQLAVYFCSICYGYHLTSSLKEKKVKRKK